METPHVVIIGHPQWEAAASDLLTAGGFAPVVHTGKEVYTNALIDLHAAAILVDGTDPDWQYWVATPKASPATRRIPVILVADRDAQGTGADHTLPPERLAAELIGWLAENARALRPAEQAALRAGCAEPLPERAQRAIEQFNAGAYYKQHDLLEEQWMAEDGPIRDLYRAILQVGVAFYQVQRGNTRGAYKMLLRAMQWLVILPDTCQGVDIARLRADAIALRQAIEAGEPLETLEGLLTRVHFADEGPHPRS
ncbi:MAG: DUF309 domain-containing protein [Chloroflexi bacterium]|nr:DUF309 domain-containing protein [Chloroflexota bacterium]